MAMSLTPAAAVSSKLSKAPPLTGDSNSASTTPASDPKAGPTQ